MKTANELNLIAVALVSAVAFTTTTLVAQDITNVVEKTTPSESPERPPYRPWTIGVGIGTDTIFGGGVSWRFSDHLGTRLGVGYMESTWDHLGVAGIEYDAKFRFLSEQLTLDIYPWQKHSFRVSVGMWLNQNELSGSVTSTGTITIDGQPITITPGSLTMKIKQQPVDPYLSFGGNLLYFDHAHHWALAGELGVAYTGNASVSLDRSASSSISDAALNHAKDRLQSYGDQFRWWPIAKLAVTFSF